MYDNWFSDCKIIKRPIVLTKFIQDTGLPQQVNSGYCYLAKYKAEAEKKSEALENVALTSDY